MKHRWPWFVQWGYVIGEKECQNKMMFGLMNVCILISVQWMMLEGFVTWAYIMLLHIYLITLTMLRKIDFGRNWMRVESGRLVKKNHTSSGLFMLKIIELTQLKSVSLFILAIYVWFSTNKKLYVCKRKNIFLLLICCHLYYLCWQFFVCIVQSDYIVMQMKQ